MTIYQSAKEAAKAAIEALTLDKVEINRQNLFDWLGEHPLEFDVVDDLDDWLEEFENHALDPADDDDDDDDSEDDEE